MSDYDHNQSIQLMPLKKILPVQYSSDKKEDPIRLFKSAKKKRKAVIFIWKYLTLIVAFISIFLSAYFVNFDDEKEEAEPSEIINGSENATMDETEAITSSAQPQRQPITVINESGIDFDINSYQGSNILLSPTRESESGIRLMIVHSHSLEYVSENISVSDACVAISQLLQSAGIGTEYCDDEFDENGRIGAYNIMKEKVKSELTENSELVLIIDLHSSDSGSPITFTVGTGSDYGWEENLRAVLAVTEYLDSGEASVRLLPGDLGQNSGVVTLNVGIGGKNFDDTTARSAIASLVNAIIRLYNENPRIAPGMAF